MTPTTKIERAIYDTKLRLQNAERQRELIIREIQVLKDQVEALETIKDDKLLS